MGGDAESGKVLRAVHKKVVDQQLGSALKLLGAAKSAHRHEDGVVEELVSKQPKPTSGRTTKEEYDEGVRLGAAGDGDGGGAAGRRIEVPDDVLKQVVSGLNESSAAGCSLLGYKEIKDLYHHGYAGTLKLVMEALLNGEATGEARAPNQHSPGTGGGPRERREAICGRCGSFFNSIWGRASTRTPISCGARRWLPTPRARALTQEAALSAVTAFTYVRLLAVRFARSA